MTINQGLADCSGGTGGGIAGRIYDWLTVHETARNSFIGNTPPTDPFDGVRAIVYSVAKGVAEELDAEGGLGGGGGGGGSVTVNTVGPLAGGSSTPGTSWTLSLLYGHGLLHGGTGLEVRPGTGIYLDSGASYAVAVSYGTTAGTAAEGNDSRIVNALSSVSVTGPLSGNGTSGSPLAVSVGTGSGTVAAGNDSRIVNALSSVSVTGALSGNGTSGSPLAITTGTTAGTIAAGNDSRITGAMQSPASPSHGDVLFYNGSAWTGLTASTAGYVLTTHGAAANPTWQSLSASGASTVQRAQVAGLALTGATSAQRLGTLEYTPSDWNLTGKSLYFKTVLSSPDGSSTATIKIYNLTTGGYVAINGGSAFTTTSATVAEQISSAITGAVTNFDPTAAAVLEVHGYVSTNTGVCAHGSTFLIAS